MITIHCANCSRQYRVDDKLAGKRVKCKECGHPIAVSASETVAAATPGEPDIFGLMESSEAEAAEKRLESVAMAANQAAPRGPQRACPSCNSNAPANAVVCLSCGYNFKTGRPGRKPAVEARTSTDEIALADRAPTRSTRRSSTGRLRNSELLNSIDRYLGVAVFILVALGLTVWCINVVKAAPSFSIYLLLPVVITLVLLAGIVAPLMLLAMQAGAYFLQFKPRYDIYGRLLMVLMLPFGMSLLCGWQVAKNPTLGDTISGSWLAAGVLFLFLFRDDLLPFLVTTIGGAVAGFVGWGIAVFAASLVTLASGPLWADAMPPGPWMQIATGHSPPPQVKPTTTEPAVATPAPGATHDPVPPPPTSTQVAIADPQPAEPFFPRATGNTDPAPGAIIPPVPVNNNTRTTTSPPPDPGTTVIPSPPAPPIPAPNNNTTRTPTVAMNNRPPEVPGTTVQTPEITPPKLVRSPFLTDLQADLADLQGCRDIISPITASTWMLVVKPLEGGTVAVQRWATDTMTKKGELTFQELPKQPNTFALSPAGTHLLVLARFPKWQLEICSFDTKFSKKLAIAENLPPGEQDAVPTLIGFIDQTHFVLRWDLQNRSAFLIYNCPGGESFRRIVPEQSENGTNEWAISPDGKTIAFLTRGPTNRELLIYDFMGGAPVRRFRPLAMDFICKGLAFSPDNKKIAVYALAQDVTTVVAFNVKGETVNTAILPTQPFPDKPVLRMRPDPDKPAPEPEPRGLLWPKANNLWLIDGAELYDPESGRKVASLGIPGHLDQRLIGTNGLVLIQRTGEDTRRFIPARFDEAAIRTAVDALKKR